MQGKIYWVKQKKQSTINLADNKGFIVNNDDDQTKRPHNQNNFIYKNFLFYSKVQDI